MDRISFTFRPDIQRLRALAIFLVIFNHFDLPLFRGGFFGVDVFFVISGFLITNNLIVLSERESKTNFRINILRIREFYLRRFFRIMPMSLFTSTLVIVFSLLTMNTISAHSVVHEAPWATGGLFNWFQIRVSEDYFGAIARTSPFLHFWSLGVEEQFYLFFPITLFVMFAIEMRIYRNPSQRPSKLTFGFFSFLTLLSLGYFVSLSSTNPILQYYSSFSRAWELFSGVLIALASRLARFNFKSKSSLVIRFLSFSVIISLSCFPKLHQKYFFPSTLLVIVSTSFLIVCQPGTRKLTFIEESLKSLAFIVGEVSYSIYLLHWPLHLFLEKTFVARLPKIYFILLQITILLMLSLLTFKFIEKPFQSLGRKISLRSSNETSTIQSEKEFVNRLKSIMKFIITKLNFYLELILVVTVVVIIGLFLYQSNANNRVIDRDSLPPLSLSTGQLAPRIPESSAAVLKQKSSAVAIKNDGLGEYVMPSATFQNLSELWKSKVNENLGLSSIPLDLRETVIAQAKEKLWPRGNCRMSLKDISCSKGRGSRLILFVGDSHAVMLQYMVLNAFDPSKYTVQGRFYPYCKFGKIIPSTIDGRPAKECLNWYQGVINEIKLKKPELLIISQMDSNLVFRNNQKLDDSSSLNEISLGMQTSLQSVQEFVKNILIIPQTVQANSIASCTDIKLNFIATCHADPKSNFSAVAMERSIATKYSISLFPINELICSKNECPAIIDGSLVFIDGNHFTNEISKKLLPLFSAFIKDKGY